MKLTDIYNEWNKDCIIDKTALDDEALNIAKLHNKYYKLYTSERLLLRKFKTDLKQLILAKHLFYTQGPSKEQIDAGWSLPPQGMILKGDLPMYMEADQDIVDMSLKIGHQEEKVDLIESIIKNINNRNFNLRVAMDFIKWTQGG